MDEEELYKDGPLRALLAQMGKATRSGNKTRWVNSPNVYQKVEVLETGTQDPKKITKWVADGSPSHSTPVKIENSNQFVPLKTDPKEFKRVQKLVSDPATDYVGGTVSNLHFSLSDEGGSEAGRSPRR